MNQQDRQNLFTELIARHQGELYGYIYSVVRNWEDTDDLYQSVCLVLWSKLESFRPGYQLLRLGTSDGQIQDWQFCDIETSAHLCYRAID